jgi:hypothetical protein
MGDMSEWFDSTFLNLAWIAQSLAWGLVVSLLGRAWIRFMSIPLSKRKEIAFWFLAPLTVLIVLALVNYSFRADGKPQLKGQIEAVNYGTIDSNKQPYLLVVASIKNIGGGQSIAEVFKLFVRLPSGVEKEGTIAAIPEALLQGMPGGITEGVFYKDSLDLKAMQPITKGGLVRGRLLFLFPDVALEALQSAVNLKLSFRDSWENQYVAEVKPDNMVKRLSSFPGIIPALVKTPPSPTPTPTPNKPARKTKRKQPVK